MERCFMFQWGVGFQMEGSIFRCRGEGVPMVGISFGGRGRGFGKTCKMGGAPYAPTMGIKNNCSILKKQ